MRTTIRLGDRKVIRPPGRRPCGQAETLHRLESPRSLIPGRPVPIFRTAPGRPGTCVPAGGRGPKEEAMGSFAKRLVLGVLGVAVTLGYWTVKGWLVGDADAT